LKNYNLKPFWVNIGRKIKKKKKKRNGTVPSAFQPPSGNPEGRD
jgi:hypothetical protein